MPGCRYAQVTSTYPTYTCIYRACTPRVVCLFDEFISVFFLLFGAIAFAEILLASLCTSLSAADANSGVPAAKAALGTGLGPFP